jgi:hypothetical protein
MIKHKHIVSDQGDESLVVIVNGEIETIAPNHLNFKRLRDYLLSGGDDETEVATLVAARTYIPNKMQQLSSRVAYVEGVLTFDGEAMDNSLSKHIVKMVHEGDDGFPAYVRFMENLSTNPSPIARRQLFDWLNAQDFTLTDDGLIVGYKSIGSDGLSVRSGSNTVYVDGEAHTGRVPNPVGARVWIARQEVDPNRDVDCSYGLHVGTHNYATTTFGGSDRITLQVHVNPRDVVAVPRDYNGAKMRVAEYVVVEQSEQKIERAIWYNPAPAVPTFEEATEDDYEEEWEDHGCPEWEREGFESEEDYQDYLDGTGDYAPDGPVEEEEPDENEEDSQSVTVTFGTKADGTKFYNVRDAKGHFVKRV